jgi:hypothetical protein
VSTREGKAILLVLLGAVAMLAGWLHDTAPYRALLIGLDATALLAVFGTGRLAELPPDPAAAPAPFLRGVARRIKKALPRGEVRTWARIRVPEGQERADELRLSVAPRAAPPGFGSIEIGVVHVRGAGGGIALPEVILRLTRGSPAEAAIAGLLRHGTSTRGRRPGERVIVFSPRLPTERLTAGLVVRLVTAVTAASAHAGKIEARRAA